MSGNFPTSPSFASVTLSVNTPMQSTETVNGRKRRVGYGTSYYTFTGKYTALTPTQVGPIQGFVAQQYGQLESFQIIFPVISYNKAADYAQAVGNAKVKTAAAVGAYQVTLKGLGANKTVINAGDYFKFGNHSKVYMATNTLVSDGSGEGVIYFSGKLVDPVVVDELVTINAVPFTVILDKDVDEWTVGSGGMTNLELNFREVW